MVWEAIAWLRACRLAADSGESCQSGVSSAQFSSGLLSGYRFSALSIVKWFMAFASALSILA